MSLLVLNIKRSLDKNHAITERDVRLLIATIEAQAKKIETLEIEKRALIVKIKADNSAFDTELVEAK